MLDQQKKARPYPDPEKPKPEVLKNLGDVFYLAMRSPSHMRQSLGSLRKWWEPPAHLEQVWVFKFDGFPRAAMSWASLSKEAQHRYVVERKGLQPTDWQSGDIPWVIDWLSPYRNYRIEATVMRWVMETGFKDRAFRYMRLGPEGEVRRIAETKRSADGSRDFRLLSPDSL
ncbi:toxin-activating lysine-acyltransferase [Halovulum sp. GXIMD14793]